MKYLFFGTPEFAALILGKLIAAGYPPAAVMCNPDRPVGRKKIVTPPPVKLVARKYHIPILQPERLSELDISTHQNIDMFIVAAYAKIIPETILKIPRLGTIGAHPSLLPKYRGPSPIQSALLAGEPETGVTLYLMDEKVDHGPILAKSKAQSTKSKTYTELLRELAELSATLLVTTLPKFIGGEITPVPQDEERATYTKKFRTQDAYVDLEKDDPAIVERKIRALNPEPGVWTVRNGKRIKLLEAELSGGKLKLKKIQAEGKRPQEL